MIFSEDNITLSALDAVVPVIGYDNIVTTENLSTTTADADFPAVNLANASTALKWVGGINTTGEEFVTVDIDSLSVDYIAIAKHNFGTEQYTIAIEVNTGNSPDWVPLSFTGMSITDDTPIIWRFEPQTLTGIRIKITTAGEGDVPPEIAVIYVGTLLYLERSIKVDVDHIPLALGLRTTVTSGMSESGNFLGRNVLNQFQESVAEFAWFEPDWYRENFDPFVEAAKDTPFFWAWNPSEYPEDTGYAWLIADAMPAVHPATRRMAVNLEMRGIA
jgi:hypothetical protein